MKRRTLLTSIAATTAGLILRPKWAQSQSRDNTLRVLSEGAANSFDAFSVGINRESIQISWNVYDRLVKFAYKAREDGTLYYDYFDIQPELAESFTYSPDKKSITFTLRPDALFHDGSPVTAEDVKWSLERVLASPIGRAQFATGSLTSPEQFVILDPLTLRIDLPRPDRLALPNLALTYPIIVNSKLAREHATTGDPFGNQWLKTNIAGGGAYKIERAEMGQRILFSRFDDWKSGSLPENQYVLWQTVPAAETRIASLIRGDADIIQDIPPKDAGRLNADPKIELIGAPTPTFQFIGMNNQLAPFNDVRIRQAIAYALPYQAMLDTGLFGRGQPLFGGKSDKPETITFPQPAPYRTNLAKAKALLAEAGMENGFTTTFSYELSKATVAEPLALLIQESLAKIGIKVTINKVPAGQLGTLLQEKSVPFFFEASTSYLADPDYFFRIFYYGDSRWNFGSYQNEEFIKLVEKTRYETDPAIYEADVKRMISLVHQDVPIILLWHPTLDFAMRSHVSGFSYSFHPQLDLRTLKDKTSN